MSITLSEAETILAAAKAEARRMGLGVSATVVDARGDFKAGFRMDGVGWFTADVCRGKAFASANFGVPTRLGGAGRQSGISEPGSHAGGPHGPR